MSNKQEQIAESVQTPWETTGTVDYDKLVDRFGAQLIDEKLIQRIEKITGKPAHPWLKRGLFYSHRDLAYWMLAKRERIFISTQEEDHPQILFT